MIPKYRAKAKSASLVSHKLAAMARRSTDMRPAWPAVTQRAVEGYRRSFDQQGPGWPGLAPETQRQRVRDGYKGTSPILVQSGKMRDKVMDPKMDEGSNWLNIFVESDILFYHQTGTTKMPKRPIHLRSKDGTFMAFEISAKLLEAYRLAT
jgi:hypothetical protein